MSRFKFYVAVGALFIGLGLGARLTAEAMHWSFKLTLLGFMLAALVAMSAFSWWQERKLARRLGELPGRERAALQALSVEARMVSSEASRKSAFVTVSVGFCLVNLPTLPLLLARLLALQAWLSLEPPLPHLLALTLGFVLAWIWWSFMVTWWRKWASSRGMSQEEVQYRGQGASILWPPGHFFERTEWANIWKQRSPRENDA